MSSNRVVLQASTNNPQALIVWSMEIGNIALNSQTLEMGPQGPLLIFKKGVLAPGQSISLRATARFEWK